MYVCMYVRLNVIIKVYLLRLYYNEYWRYTVSATCTIQNRNLMFQPVGLLQKFSDMNSLLKKTCENVKVTCPPRSTCMLSQRMPLCWIAGKSTASQNRLICPPHPSDSQDKCQTCFVETTPPTSVYLKKRVRE